MTADKSEGKPSKGAMRAAEVIARRYQLGPNDSTRKLIAITIDKEAAAPETARQRDALLEAAELLLSRLNNFNTDTPKNASANAQKMLRAAIADAKKE